MVYFGNFYRIFFKKADKRYFYSQIGIILKKEDVEMEVQIILRKLGVGSTYKGYKATVLAVTLALEDEDRLSSVTKRIYGEVAEATGSTPSAVEKNIRTVVLRAWSKNRADLEMMAGYKLDIPPSPSEFLDILYTYIARSRIRRDKTNRSLR